jgi:type VI secretion system secreted protein VgrG
MALLQENRALGLSTPLGDDVLLLTAFHGSEHLSRLFKFELDLISDNDAITAAEIVGKNVTISLKLTDESPRFFNGFVSELVAGDAEDGRRNYRATLVPWLWFLSQTADCRIFQQKTVIEIIGQIFGDLGFSDYETSEIKGDHKQWDYCVQYRETDFNFVSRLMEREGIFYYFRHEDGKHTLVLADHAGAYKDCTENEVDYPPSRSRVAIADHIKSWSHRFGFVPGKWAQTDHNFETPSTNLMTNSQSVVSLPGIDKYEVYDYPGEYQQKTDGETEVKLRMEEEEVEHDTINAASLCKSFTPGGKFTITGERAGGDKDQSFVITTVHHTATEPLAYETGSPMGEDYSNSFTCIPESVVFRPARVSPEPMISGVQTAVVVGPSGEEIHTDEYGRVKVQFHWDREGKKDESSSCWIRVAHSSAGRKWGVLSIPRIGQEVVVDFLEGDPDRPLIVGSVYNAEQMPPYELPANQTLSYIKTNSSKDGDGFNELRIEDKKDKEQIFLHAERNMDVRVKNDSNERVVANRNLIVGSEDNGGEGDQVEFVHGNKHLGVKNDHVEKLDKNMYLTVAENQEVVVHGDTIEKVGGGAHLAIDGSQSESVGGDMSLDVGSNLHQKVGMNSALEAGQAVHIKGGMNVVIEAGLSLTLKVGGNFVNIGPTGVSIQGTMVMINSGGAAGSGSGASPSSPSDPTEVGSGVELLEPTQADDSKTGNKSC